MAFDPTTAKPTQEQQPVGGFDISTATPAQAPQQPDFPGAAVIEPARAVISGAGRAIAGGIGGIFQALNPLAEEGAGAETVREFQEGAFQPTTEAGRQGLEALGGLVQKGVDIANFPISGIAGLVELVSGQGLDQAAETIKSTQEQGISTTAGQRVFEETGSPLAATIAEVAPTAALELIGLKGAGVTTRAASQVPPVARQAITTAGQAITEAGRAVAPTAAAIFKFQSPTKQRIAKLIEEGSTDVETARFQLAEPRTQLERTLGISAPTQPGGRLQEFLNVGGPRVKTDRVAVEAIDQGFDEGVIAAVKGASKADKTQLLKMVDIMEKGKKNRLFAQTNRPSDVAGNTLMGRYRSIVTANKNAGKQLNVIANSLKGKQVDSLPAVNTFIDDLDSIGVTLSSDLKPIFSGSDIEGVRGAENAITQIVNRMKLTKTPDAHDLHRLKRFIDEQVTFGKSIEGLSGRTEGILKNLRRNLDGILDTNFPEYDRVNTVFSETIGAIDSLQDVAGRKLNLTGPNADKAVGTLLRRVMGNQQSRIRLLDSVGDIEAVAIKHGGLDVPRLEGVSAGKNDLLTQILFVDELDAVFGPVARASFQGQIEQAITTAQGLRGVSPTELALGAAQKAATKARGINQPGAFKAIKELLKETK